MKETNNLTQKTVRGMLWMLSGAGAQAIFQFIVLIALARLLDPESFGIVNAATVIISITMIFSTLGVGPALIQKENITQKHIGTAFTSTLILGVIFGVLLFIFSGKISYFFHSEKLIPILQVFSIVFVMQGASAVAESLLKRDLNFRLLVRIQVISYLFYGVIGITLAYLNFEEWALALAFLGNNIVRLILLIYYRFDSVRFIFDKNAFKELMIFSGGYSLAQLSGEVSLQGDNLVVGRFLGPESLGLYSRAYQLMVFPTNLIGKVMENVLFPAMSKKQGNLKSLQYAYLESVKIISYVTVPFSLLMIILTEDIILFLFGEKWIGITFPFQILAAGLLFRTSYKISDALVNAVGAVYKRALIKWIYAFLVISLSIIGQRFGISGVAMGVLIAILFNFWLMAEISLKLISLKRLDFLKVHLGSIILGLSIALLIPFNNISYISNLNTFLTLILNSLIYMIIVMVITLIRPKYFLGDLGYKLLLKMKSK